MFLFDSDLWPAASSCSLQIWARLTGFLPCWRWAAGIPVSDRARSGTVRCRRLYNSIHSQDRPRCQRSWGQRLRCVFYGTIAPWFADSRPRFLKTRKSLDTTLQRPKPLPLLGFEVLGSWQWPRRYKSGKKQCVFGTWCSSLAHDFRRCRFQVLPRFCGDSPVYQCQGRQQAWLEGGAPGPMVTYPSYTRLSRLFATG